MLVGDGEDAMPKQMDATGSVDSMLVGDREDACQTDGRCWQCLNCTAITTAHSTATAGVDVGGCCGSGGDGGDAIAVATAVTRAAVLDATVVPTAHGGGAKLLLLLVIVAMVAV